MRFTAEKYQDYDVLPEGWYKAKIAENAILKSNDGRRNVLVLDLKITEGSYAGAQFKHRINIVCESDDENTRNFLPKLLHQLAAACVIPEGQSVRIEQDGSDILHKQICIYVKPKPSDKADSKAIFNNVLRLKPLSKYEELKDTVIVTKPKTTKTSSYEPPVNDNDGLENNPW